MNILAIRRETGIIQAIVDLGRNLCPSQKQSIEESTSWKALRNIIQPAIVPDFDLQACAL